MFFLIFGVASCAKKDDDNNTNGDKSTIVFNSNVTYGTTTDRQGNSYKTVNIGGKTWMAENLRVTTYNDGTPIPRTLIDSAGYPTSAGAYDNYNGTNNADTIRDMGRLYDWYAVNTGKLAPVGWHVATEAEWDALIAAYGGVSNAGGKLKETGVTHWNTPNADATNESGFSAMPAGEFYVVYKLFRWYNDGATFWSATSLSPGEARYYTLAHTDGMVGRMKYMKKCGYSVRCVKD